MNDVTMEQWIDALLSGKYEQGDGGLRCYNSSGPDLFCCMGVLADQILPGEWELPDKRNSFFFSIQGEEGYLPSEMALQMEIPQDGGFYLTESFIEDVRINGGSEDVLDRLRMDLDIPGYTSLVCLNDGDMSFEDIAAVIKSEPAWRYQ